LARWTRGGRKLILATGETVDQLQAFPDLKPFDLVVAENGGVLYWPNSGRQEILGVGPPSALIHGLRRAGVAPLHVGEVVLSTRLPFDRAASKVVEDLNLPWRLVRNRKEVMLLPQGTDKGTGLRAALQSLGVPLSDVVGVGDAQNDVALLQGAAFGAAVRTAVPQLKAAADVVLEYGSGRAVAALIDRLLAAD
jgi:hydroxymethylpyrimidine pyrophosphatase-like HAD family hydrolase